MIYKQPGANVIGTVDAIQAAMPRLAAIAPQGLKVDTIIDRTQTIRASVKDVEFTLAITIGLVVMVILLFLRNIRATLIPSVTVPLALLGSTALMYLFGFSLDNLSLMALTIAVGFVVDDAIVVVENIYRHVEAGTLADAIGAKGASEIGFTVVSISISLVAVFIPLLLMGGIIGRLFREFAITVTAAIGVSVIVSLTLTPMLASRFLAAESEHHGRIYNAIEWGFETLIDGYRKGLDTVLRHQFLTLMAFFATMACTGGAVRQHPQGLLSGPGHRLDPGHRLCRARRLSGPDARHSRAAFRRPGARKRYRRVRIVFRQWRRQYAQHRPIFRRTEAARRAQVLGHGHYQPVAAAARQNRGRPALPAAVTGHHRRRHDLAPANTNTRCRIRASTS